MYWGEYFILYSTLHPYKLHESAFQFFQFVIVYSDGACLFSASSRPLVAHFFQRLSFALSFSLFLHVIVIFFSHTCPSLSYLPSSILDNFLVSSPWFLRPCSRCISLTTLDFNYIFFHILLILLFLIFPSSPSWHPS